MSGKVWTPERCTVLRTLKAQGVSYARIAKLISADKGPRVTRCAVSGQCKRMGLTNPARTQAERSAMSIRGGGGRNGKAKQPYRAKPAAKLGAEMSPRSIPFYTHRDGKECAMFIAGEEGSLGLVCGRPVIPGDVWCADCKRIVYEPAARARAA